ncbi:MULTISPECIES: hypothetical protein [16SrI (Aster yellows group)]|uniref:Uncharacterized protein n=2 Tax=16SrI (Aster yellows group) TaxID=3042590 RepID=A0A859IAJ7_9MOLU|nr:hypothetical protein [Chrysanthemum yellows phytoplasma]QKX95714.1 MAG: hypothetical protein RP166_7790 [Rapeseed phyllody phytoplasma]
MAIELQLAESKIEIENLEREIGILDGQIKSVEMFETQFNRIIERLQNPFPTTKTNYPK